MKPPIDETHNPGRRSVIASANQDSEFPIQNLPFGVFHPRDASPRAGVAIGDQILDLGAAVAASEFASEMRATAAVEGGALNALLARPADERRALRRWLSRLLAAETGDLRPLSGWLYPMEQCALQVPATIGDYTDFYAGIHHAVAVGKLFRPDAPLLPNYKHVPIGYHGRASSVRVSGTPVHRPHGQILPPGASAPRYAASSRLDLELELGVWIAGENALGDTIDIDTAHERIAGLCLLNDWSARDLQAWEYQPLGPFLAKNFMTTISPWIVTTEALTPFRIAPAPRVLEDPKPLPHLWSVEDQASGGYAIKFEVALSTPKMRQEGRPPQTISRGPASNLYWTLAQLVTHHASGGCNLRPGDLLGTGTISTPDDRGRGSLLELTQGGQKPLVLANGEQRTFLEDGDELTLRGRAHAKGFIPIGFGPCVGRIIERS